MTSMQNRFRRTEGTISKAERSRQIVREMQDAPRKEIITEIQEQLEFDRAMARHYFYCAVQAIKEGK